MGLRENCENSQQIRVDPQVRVTASTAPCFPSAAAAASEVDQTEVKTAATDRTRAEPRVSLSSVRRSSLLECPSE